MWKDVGEPETNGKNRGSSRILMWGNLKGSSACQGI